MPVHDHSNTVAPGQLDQPQHYTGDLQATIYPLSKTATWKHYLWCCYLATFDRVDTTL